jgi:hypothetical protein
MYSVVLSSVKPEGSKRHFHLFLLYIFQRNVEEKKISAWFIWNASHEHFGFVEFDFQMWIGNKFFNQISNFPPPLQVPK